MKRTKKIIKSVQHQFVLSEDVTIREYILFFFKNSQNNLTSQLGTVVSAKFYLKGSRWELFSASD